MPAALPPVLGDGPRVRQVLVNLLGNAVKFTDRGSVLVRADVDGDAKRVSVSIQDTGIGIAPESLPLLFEKFRQLDASHTRRHGGVGLGLAISKALMDRMGGSIEIRSDGLGQGHGRRRHIGARNTRIHGGLDTHTTRSSCRAARWARPVRCGNNWQTRSLRADTSFAKARPWTTFGR